MGVMKQICRCFVICLVIICVHISSQDLFALNLLTDPSFESGTVVPSAMGGWNAFGGTGFSQDYAHSGTFSMKTTSDADISGAIQGVPATVGATYMLTGWAYLPVALQGAVAFLVLDFGDVNGAVVGNSYQSILLDSSSPVGAWIPLSVTATVPAGAAIVVSVTYIFNFSNIPGPTAFYDDLTLTQVPEPSLISFLAFGLVAVASWRRPK